MLNKKKIAETILGESQTDNIFVTNDNFTQDSPNEIISTANPQTFSLQTPSTSGLNFYNPSGCTFTFNITSNK